MSMSPNPIAAIPEVSAERPATIAMAAKALEATKQEGVTTMKLIASSDPRGKYVNTYA